MAEAVTTLAGTEPEPDGAGLRLTGTAASAEALRALAFAHGWTVTTGHEDGRLRLQPAHP
jgi:hypothetical protein